MEHKRKVRRGGLVGPLLLIGAGAVALLTNVGYLDWSIWGTLLRIWPVFLIAAGLDLLIGRRSALGSLAVLCLILAVFAVGIWLAWLPASGSAVASDEISVPLGDAKRAEVLISRAAGTLDLGSLAGSRNLAEGSIASRRGQHAVEDISTRGDTAIYSLRNTGNVVGPIWAGTGSDWLWELGLNPNVPLSLEVNSAAGQATLDLGSLLVDRLQVSQAAGQTTIMLPADGNLDASVDGAVGLIEIIVPEGQEARIEFSTVLVTRKVPARFVERDSAYTTPGYENAESRIDLEIGLILGSVEVRSSK